MELIKWLRYQWDRASAVVLVAGGFVAIILGWRGIANATLPTEQIPYLASGGLIGLFLLAVGSVLWLSADLRDEWRKLEEINDALRAAAALPDDPVEPSDPVVELANSSSNQLSGLSAPANGRSSSDGAASKPPKRTATPRSRS